MDVLSSKSIETLFLKNLMLFFKRDGEGKGGQRRRDKEEGQGGKRTEQRSVYLI